MTSASEPKRFILLGDAGVGKSSLINFLYNMSYGTKDPKNIFCTSPQVKLSIPCANWLDCLDKKYRNKHSERDINDQIQSQTQKCMTYSFRTADFYLELIDTPGFNDTNGFDVDERNLDCIEKTLKQLPFLNGIIIVINGALPRLGVSFKNVLHSLYQIWPNDLLNNCVAVLTNCDKLSVNLDPAILHDHFKIDDSRVFHLQNSLFRWNPKNQSSKAIRRFEQDFEDTLDITETLVRKLLQFNSVSTQVFEIGGIKIALIENCIIEAINKIISLINIYKDQTATEDGISNAHHTMQCNEKWEKDQEITVMRWDQSPQHQSRSLLPAKSENPSKFIENRRPASAQSASSSGRSCEKDISRSFVVNRDPHGSYSTNDDYMHKNNPSAHTDNDTGQHCRPPEYKNPSSNHHHHHDPQESRSSTCSSSLKQNTDTSFHHDSSHNSTHSTTRPYSARTAGYPSSSATAETCGKDHKISASHDRDERHDTYSRERPHDQKYSKAHYDHDDGYNPHNPMYRQQTAKVRVTLPDNETRSHYTYAEQQEFMLKNKAKHLIARQQKLETEINSSLTQLKAKVTALLSIKKNYDIIGRTQDLLTKFNKTISVMDENIDMKRYYDATVKILSNKRGQNQVVSYLYGNNT
ncbi:unnamed protein product [Rotaria socialis]|uniref:G domain-containing protein n=1 Tax=Rotaria socialis TaxID=392032 RepID=A0A821J0Z4_9BILA|nr:unnamed protein product [Rotaria socialis]CAF4713857.1 unnamed protein product [Rotaria socialis]